MRRAGELAIAAGRTLAWLEHSMEDPLFKAHAKQMSELAADLRYGLGTAPNRENGK